MIKAAFCSLNARGLTISLKVQSRLEHYWLVSKKLLALVTDSGMVTSAISHHCAMTPHLQSKEYVQRGPGFWKIYKIPEFKSKHDYLDDRAL